MGQQVWDYTHQCDHSELRDLLSNRHQSKKDEQKRHGNVLVRIKCTLTSRGRSVNIKSASFKVKVHVNRLWIQRNERSKSKHCLIDCYYLFLSVNAGHQHRRPCCFRRTEKHASIRWNRSSDTASIQHRGAVGFENVSNQTLIGHEVLLRWR